MTKSVELTRDADQGKTRRGFLALASAAALAAAAGTTGLLSVLFMRPRVTYGPPAKLLVGRPDSYASGTVLEFPDSRLVVRRTGNKFAAISTECTHLGCIVAPTDTGFDCPCHGSRFDSLGNVTGGPAPKPLPWFRVAVAPNGELEVDKRQVVDAGTTLEVTT